MKSPTRPPAAATTMPKMLKKIATILMAKPNASLKPMPKGANKNPQNAVIPLIKSITEITPPKAPARRPANAPLPILPRAIIPAKNPPIKWAIMGRTHPRAAMMRKPTKVPSQKLPESSKLRTSLR